MEIHIRQRPHDSAWHDKVWKSDARPKCEIEGKRWNRHAFQAWSATTAAKRPEKAAGSLFQVRCALTDFADLISWVPGSDALKAAFAAASAFVVGVTSVSGAFGHGLSESYEGHEDQYLFGRKNNVKASLSIFRIYRFKNLPLTFLI